MVSVHRYFGAGKRPAVLALLPVLAPLLAGCAVGPDFKTPDAPKVAGYTSAPLPDQTVSAPGAGGEAQRFAQGADIPAEWWTLFHSAPLDALIKQAIAANPDLKAAEAALRSARATADAQRGGYYPQVSGGLDGTRAKNANSVSSASSSSSSIYSLYTAQLAVSYVPDVWGANARAVENLDAQAEAQRFQGEAAYLTLTANVAATAVAQAALRSQIVATRDIVDIEAQSLALMRKQLELGQIAEADAMAQEAALAQARQALPPLEKQLAQTNDLLAVLCGRFPSQADLPDFDLSALTLPATVPVSLPSQLVAQRPDIRTAVANLHAASAEMGVAIANRLPQITLSAGYGTTSGVLGGSGGLFTPGMGFWDVAGGVTAPLFDGFTLEQKQKAAEAGLDQAMWQYRGTVLTAFQNVADTLTALDQDAKALKAADDAERAAAASLAVARRQLELGDIGALGLLNAQQTERQASLTLIQARAARFTDTVALFQALGGGWWNRDKAVEAADRAKG